MATALAGAVDRNPPTIASRAACVIRFKKDDFEVIAFLSLVVEENFPSTADRENFSVL
jgi:hypothetical protein